MFFCSSVGRSMRNAEANTNASIPPHTRWLITPAKYSCILKWYAFSSSTNVALLSSTADTKLTRKDMKESASHLRFLIDMAVPCFIEIVAKADETSAGIWALPTTRQQQVNTRSIFVAFRCLRFQPVVVSIVATSWTSSLLVNKWRRVMEIIRICGFLSRWPGWKGKERIRLTKEKVVWCFIFFLLFWREWVVPLIKLNHKGGVSLGCDIEPEGRRGHRTGLNRLIVKSDVDASRVKHTRYRYPVPSNWYSTYVLCRCRAWSLL